MLTISRWCSEWSLSLNDEKCSVLHLDNSNPGIEYIVGGTVIRVVDSQSDFVILVMPNHLERDKEGK